MKHFAYNSSYDSQLFGILLAPSWLSGLVSSAISLIFVAFGVVSDRYKGSNTHLQFFHFEHGQAHGSTAISHALDSNRLISNLPLLLFWCLIGVVIYMFAVNIVGAVQHAAQFNDTLAHYANLNRRVMIRSAIEKLVLRTIVLIVWIPYIVVFFKILLPHVVNLALQASPQPGSVSGVWHLALAITILALGIHLHAVLLRLLLLRPRLFSGALYIS